MPLLAIPLAATAGEVAVIAWTASCQVVGAVVIMTKSSKFVSRKLASRRARRLTPTDVGLSAA